MGLLGVNILVAEPSLLMLCIVQNDRHPVVQPEQHSIQFSALMTAAENVKTTS